MGFRGCKSVCPKSSKSHIHVSSYNDILPKSAGKVKGIFIRSLNDQIYDDSQTLCYNHYTVYSLNNHLS